MEFTDTWVVDESGLSFMKVDVHPRQSGTPTRFLVALPILLGIAVILVIRLGPGPALLTIVIAVVAVTIVLRGATRWSARRYGVSVVAPGVLLRAEAGMDGAAGIVTLAATGMRWVPRRHSPARPDIDFPATHIVSVDLVPIDSIFAKAARLTIHTDGGEIKRLTITAAPAAVEQVLRTMG
jgi:hypothetical protein